MATDRIFSAADERELAAHGLDRQDALQQILFLRQPPPPIVLDRPATVGDGIERLGDGDQDGLAELGRRAAAAGRITKFVPASGAATRMFMDLITAAAKGTLESGRTHDLFDHFESFPFAEELRRRAGVTNREIEDVAPRILNVLLEEMGYARRPKALIAFHRDETRVRTAFEEQLHEAALYARSEDGRCRVHFTVAAGARGEFENVLADVREEIESRYECRLDVTFSEQHPATDTLAIDREGSPFRTAEGALLFRPGGHGALLRNVAALGADLISIKNIDNILPHERLAETILWKQILIGALVRLEGEVHEHLRRVTDAGDEALEGALALAASRFSRHPRVVPRSLSEKREAVLEVLDRPLRVCGVVRNEGEPGGAPFWVRGSDGATTLQIVEAAQVNPNDAQQMRLFRASTHFNPVDIIASTRRWNGQPHDLDRFVDHDAVFIADKSYEGRELRALELPGLWNGAMAGWNTICVGVPASTFAPVKTVFDLLRPQHQLAPRARSSMS